MPTHHRPALPTDWKTLPFPNTYTTLPFNKPLTAKEAAQVSLGLLPQQMEDKWFIYLDLTTYWLHFHRSWTGFCIYRVRLEFSNTTARCTEAQATRDPEQYRSTDDAYDVQMIHFLIDSLLLGRTAEFPHRAEEVGAAALEAWHLIGRGRTAADD